MVWRVKKSEPIEPIQEIQEIKKDINQVDEEEELRAQLKRIEERKKLQEIKPIAEKNIDKDEPEISKEELGDMIQGHFDRALYLFNAYRRM
jgi:hypothetical protein